LHEGAQARLKAHGVATLHSIGSLWEADQAHIEHLAAQVDAQWYRRWSARSVVDRLLRHGGRQPDAFALPYST
jgi:hypothetical protein